MEAAFLACMSDIVAGRKVTPIDIGVDSSAAVSHAHDFVSNSRVRHFERYQLKVREYVARGVVTVTKVGTDDNAADIFTKALGRKKFEKFRKVLLNM